MSVSKRKKPKNPLGFQSTTDLFAKYAPKKSQGYISQEFQDFGYRLAVELEDLKHKSLYMRMAKREDRGILEKALSFVSDSNAKSKARLFMWKVKQLKEEREKILVSESSVESEAVPVNPGKEQGLFD